NTHTLHLEYMGTCGAHADVLTDSILTGYLQSGTEEVLNLINARYLADFNGIRVEETIGKESRTYADLIRIRFGKAGSYITFGATLFGPEDFRIVELDGFPIEIALEGGILLYRNADKP